MSILPVDRGNTFQEIERAKLAYRWDLLRCMSSLATCNATTGRHGRSCSFFKPNRRLYYEADKKWQCAGSTPEYHSSFCNLTQTAKTVTSSKYHSSFCNLTQTAKTVPYKSKPRCSQVQQLLLPQHTFPCCVIVYNRCLNDTLSPLLQCRHVHISHCWKKEESKVEKTVKALKHNERQTEQDEPATATPPKKGLWPRFVDFCKHYYHGFRLLAIDVNISCKLLWLLLRGKTLTRREHNQLVRTTADMFRLVPLLVFIVVPFAEFLLPFVLIFFPNILPSTFQDPNDEKEKRKKKLKAKLEMARFLQKTINESAVETKNPDGQTVQSFALFIDKIRKEGTKPNTKDIMKFAQLFEDEITLDNLTRSQLRACCIILNITPIGTDALLRFILQMKLRSLQTDDKLIQKEGLENLNISELQAANRARGMRALGVSEERLREQMQQWLQLHLKEKIPTSLLLLSRALYLPETLSTEEKLGATITKLPVTATDEAKVKVAEMSGEAVDNKIKFDIIKHEEAIIAAEKEQLAREIKLMEDKSIRDLAEAKAAETVMSEHLVDTAKVLTINRDENLTDHAKVLTDNAKLLQASPGEHLRYEEAAKITAKDLDDMESVLAEIAKERRLNVEQDALKGLKENITEYKEDLEVLKDVAISCGDKDKQYEQSSAARHLAKKVDHMISRLDSVMAELEQEKASMENKISKVEKSLGKGAAQEKMDGYKTNIVSINEMIDALKRLKKVPSDSKLQQVFRVLDQDKDGVIDINDALRVLELLSEEHLKLSANQLEEVLSLLRHEASLDEEERQQHKQTIEQKHSGKERE